MTMLRLSLTLSAFFIAIIVFAQTPPAGVGSNNIVWLEANDLSGPLADGFTWPDKSGNGFDAIDIADGSNVVTLTTISGNQYLSFAGIVDEQLVIADDDGTTDLLDNSSEFSVIAVFASDTEDPTAVISKRLSFGNSSWSLFYNNGLLMYGYAGTTTVGGSGSIAAGPHITTMTVDAALSGSSAKMFVNSGAEGSTGSNLSIPDRTEDIYIGLFNAGDSRYFDGEIAEIIIYRDALNGGERLVLENYLAEKYGITITADYFGNYSDYNASYDDDMRGIGTEDGSETHSISGFSSGFQVEEIAGLDNANEFILFTHDASVAHADNVTANISDPDITDRWQKDYYVETSQSGVVDAASVNVQLTFDFDEAGLVYSGTSTDYVLLYRATTADDFTRVYANDYSESGNQIIVDVPASRFQSGYYTLGRGVQLTSRTWYVLQNGDWSDPDTWTLDAGTAPIPDNDLNETPGIEDEVVIRNGKTVTIQSTTNNLTVGGITVDGALNLTTSSGHDFNVINGQGTIRMAGSGGVSNFPDGNTITSDGFGNPANGGLLIVQDALEFDQNETFKDVRILTDDPADVVALGADLTINGDFNVRYGTLQFGDGTTTNRTFTVVGDFSVENNGGSQDGRVTTAVASNTRHEFNLYGDFLNEGTAQFSDRTVANFASESTNGVVDLNLISTNADQRVDCNGLTYFYRLEIVKGSTDFTADIQADDPGNFVLTGYANQSIGGDVDEPSDNENAFSLITGSASVGTNVNVRLNTTGNYSIGADARLVVNGGEVTKTGGAAVTPYGTIEVQAGILEVPSGSGITTRDAGQIVISGGEIWTPQIRTSIQGTIAQGGFQQTGGTVNIWGYSALESPILGQAASSPYGGYSRFCLTYEGNSFTMSGGTLNLKDDVSDGLIFINSDPANISVTGGTVNVYSTSATNPIIASNADFWDLNLIQESTGAVSIETLTCGPGGADDRTITDPDLGVLHDLNIGDGAELIMNDNDLYIGEDLTIEENISGVTYQPGSNTTYFNGTLNGLITLNTTAADIGTGRLDFNNVVVDKPSVERGIYCEYNIPNFGGNVIRVIEDMTVESGFWHQGTENLDLRGGNITNNGILGVYEPGVFEGEIVLRSDPVVLNTEDGAQFGYVRDNNRFTIELSSDVYIQRLRWRRGLWKLGTHNLRIDQLDIRPNTNEVGADYVDEDGGTVCENCLSVNYMFSTEGNASDGGLSLMMPISGINEAVLRSDNGDATRDIFDYRGNVIANTNGGGGGDNLFIFPLGVGDSGIDIEFGDPSGTTTADTSKYTPMYLRVQDMTGVTEDSVYVTVRPVEGELQTADLSGGDAISYYWNIEHGYTGTTPTITFESDYYTDDLDGSLNETSFVGGQVEDGGAYDRRYEDDGVPEDELVDDTENRITIDGDGDTGISLSNTNVTAGESGRFIGNPTIYYNIDTNGTRDWDDTGKWSTVSHASTTNTGTYPQAGDIARISNPGSGGDGRVTVQSGFTAEAALVLFDNDAGASWGNRVSIETLGIANFAEVQGDVGELYFELSTNSANAAEFNGDIGDFAQGDGSVVVYRGTYSTSGPSANRYEILPVFPEYPNIKIEGSTLYNTSALNLNGRLWVANVSRLEAEADIISLSRIDVYHGGDLFSQLSFGSGVPGVNIACDYLRIGGGRSANGIDAFVDVDGAPSSGTHRLTVNKQIEFIDVGGRSAFAYLDLYDSPTAYAELELISENDGYLSKIASTNTVELHSIELNKGTDTTYSFTFNEDFVLPLPSDISAQPIEIVNGVLIFDDVDIDVTLSDATNGSFYLPNTLNSEASSGSGGLEILAGTVNLGGDDTGIILDGLLRISGGTLDMSDDSGDNGNNFIQYGASDNALIEISDGSLLVGSQVRRPLTTTSGLLNYVQTGGIARFGITAAPESTRGVFELRGSGSEFTHTAGEFTVVRQNGSSTVGSLIIKPDADDIDISGSTITIGSTDTPTGQTDIGIDANVPLGEVVITGNNSPIAKIYNIQLEVGNLTIQSGGTFDANGYDLTINGDLTNDGTYENSGTDINQQTTFIPTTGPQAISGTGTTNFFNLEKDGSDVLTVGQDVTVENDLSVLDGTVSTSTFAINVEGDMQHEAIHQSDAAGPGIVFNGTDAQNLDTSSGTAEFGVLTMDNSNGLDISGDGKIFQINEKVILSTGIFNIGGNLLIMDEDAVFENGSGGQSRADFNVNSMISVNASITDNGVRKLYTDDFTGTYLYPVGLNFYTPAEVNVTDLSDSNGDDSQITIKPIEDIAGGIPDDFDEICISPVETGTTTGTTANRLVDASQNFLTTVTIGDRVENITDETFATVTAINSDSEITLDLDIFVAGEDYQLGPDFVDLDNILQFYWSIRSENIENFDGSIYLYHVDDLEAVNNTLGLDLTNYAPARLLNSSSTWDKGYSADQFDEAANVSQFSLISGDYTDFTSEDIAGTYTAGITVVSNTSTALCGGAIPDEVPEYVTVATSTNGDVDDIASYDTAPGGTVPALGESPDLRVAGDFTLNLTNQFWRFRKVTIESGATLTISGAGVNLGTVEGDGTLKLINTNSLPAGDYASFEADAGCTTGGGFEMEVTTGNSVDLTLPFNRLRRLILSGDGEKVVTNGSTFNICENLEILDGGVMTMGDNTTFNIQGNIIKDATASFDGDFTNAQIVMVGSSQQQIDGDFTGSNQIKYLEVDNSAGLTVVNAADDSVEVENLVMTDGIITTDEDNSLIILSTGDITGNFSSSTFVDGPLVRRLETSTDRQLFPVGDGSVYLPLEVSNTLGYTGTKDWVVTYWDTDPGAASRVTTVSGATVNATTDFSTWNSEEAGYATLYREDLFEVTVESPATADIRAYWDGDSDVGADADSWQYLRLMVWDAGDQTWESYGNGNGNYSGMSASGGSIVSDTDLSFSTNFVTLGSNEPIPLPVELLSFAGIIEDNQTRLSWETASEVNNDYFEVQHSVDGVNFDAVGTVQGNGNSSEVITYGFVHNAPALGVNYYRLKQVDYDGVFEIHETIQVENNGGRSVHGMEVSTYPNPTTPENLNVRILTGDNDNDIIIKVINISGQSFIDTTFPGALTVDEKLIPVKKMIPGIYFMQVQQGDKTKKHKIIIK